MKTFEMSPRLMKEAENFKYKCEECVSCIWDKEDEDWRCVRFHCFINKAGHACANFTSKEERRRKLEEAEKRQEFQRYLQDVALGDVKKAIGNVETVKNGIKSVDGQEKLKRNVQITLNTLERLERRIKEGK